MFNLDYIKELAILDKVISKTLEKLFREKIITSNDYSRAFTSNLGENFREQLNPLLFTKEDGIRALATSLKVGDLFSEAIMYAVRTRYILSKFYSVDLVVKYPFLNKDIVSDIITYAGENPNNMKEIVIFFIEARYFGKGFTLDKTDSMETFNACNDSFIKVKNIYSIR